MHCPDCRKPLVRTRHPGDVQWACVDCRRRLVADATLEVLLTDEAAVAFVAARVAPTKQGPRPCPGCRHRMAVVAIDLPRGPIVVDRCGRCRTTWFDRGEFEQLPKDVATGAIGSTGATVVVASEGRERVLARPDGRLAPGDEEFGKPFTWCTPVVLCAMFVSTFGIAFSGRTYYRRRWIGRTLTEDDVLSLDLWSWPPDRSWIAQALDVPALFVHSGLLASLVSIAAFGVVALTFERRAGGWRTLALAVAANGLGRVLHVAAFGAGEPIPSGAGAAITALAAALAVMAPWSALANVPGELADMVRHLGESLPQRRLLSPFPRPPDARSDPPPSPPPGPPRGLARVPLIALLPSWIALDAAIGRIPLGLHRYVVVQPTSLLQYVGGLLVGLLFGGWWRAFTLRHPATARRSADR